MNKRMLIAAVALGFVLVACGRESYDTLDVGGSTRPTPSATSTPKATTTPAASATPVATATAAGAAATQAPSGEVPKAAEGQINRPKAGRYVYDLTGEQTNPLNPSAPPEKFAPGAQTTLQTSHQGNVTTDESTSSEQAGRAVYKSRWESTKVSLLSINLESQAGSLNCTFDPPLVIVHIPIKPEKFPTQSLKGSGNACNGKVDITVEGRENVKDATGRSWSTWRVKVRQEVKTDQLTTVGDEIRWFSPDLGTQVRTQVTQNGTYSGLNFASKSNTVLRSRP
jgi:hypothetical protein